MNKTESISYSLKNSYSMRFHYVDEKYDGVVVHNGKKVLILKHKIDFVFDGFQVLQRSKIKKVRNNKCDRVHNEIITFTGEIEAVNYLDWFGSVDTYEDFLTNCKDRDIWPAVETTKHSGGSFYLGKLISVDSEGFTIFCYDALGDWEKEYFLTYDMIERIEFDSSYTNSFNGYMRKAERSLGK